MNDYARMTGMIVLGLFCLVLAHGLRRSLKESEVSDAVSILIPLPLGLFGLYAIYRAISGLPLL